MFGCFKKLMQALGRQDDALQTLRQELQTVRVESWRLHEGMAKMKQALGRVESRQLQMMNRTDINANEFQAFSQWGEDGIIDFLVRHVPIPRKIFVEFGVQNYVESNTRFLLLNHNWSGLILDSGADNIHYIKQDGIYWQHNLKAVQAFITRDNINQLLTENGIQGEIGLLSVDIDGNDYWVWEAIDCISPAIVITEYNSRFGPSRAVTVPYQPEFDRSTAHYSHVYYGASLPALAALADRKGYDFVGCSTGGNNAFFVRKDLRPEAVRALSVPEGFRQGQFREARNPDGTLAFLSLEEEQAILSQLPLVEVP